MTTGREIARALRAAYLALHRQTNGCFADEGVTADQFVLLSALADEDAVTQQELVRRVGSDPNTVRAMLLLLEDRGLVARERLLAAFGPDEVIALVGLLRRVAEAMSPRAKSGSRTTKTKRSAGS